MTNMANVNASIFAKSFERRTRGEILHVRYGKRWEEYRGLWNDPLKNGGDISFPLAYEVQLTDSCNLRCGHCYSRNRRTGVKLSKEDIEKVFLEGEANGLCAVSFGFDSESLLDFDLLMYAVKSAVSHNVMDILINTNGILLTEERAAELCKYATMIKISVDAASAETYDKMRHSDKYDVLVGNIENLVALRNRLDSAIPMIRLSFCRTYVNSCEEKIFIEKWENIVDKIDIQNYIGVGEFQELSSGKRAEMTFCADPFRRIAILANGDVQCCCSAVRNRDILLGNIHGETISDLWNGEKLKAIKDAFAEDLGSIPDYCKECLNNRWIFE